VDMAFNSSAKAGLSSVTNIKSDFLHEFPAQTSACSAKLRNIHGGGSAREGLLADTSIMPAMMVQGVCKTHPTQLDNTHRSNSTHIWNIINIHI